MLRRTLLVLASVMALGGTAAASSADAAIVWNHTGGWVPQYFAPNQYASNIKSWLPPSSHFTMTCWVDNTWDYGNYWSNRWFGGWGWTGQWGYVPASYVYYQNWVPHC